MIAPWIWIANQWRERQAKIRRFNEAQDAHKRWELARAVNDQQRMQAAYRDEQHWYQKEWDWLTGQRKFQSAMWENML